MEQIRDLLESGQLVAGDKLPAERDLAARLLVSRNTVREALRMLEIGGFIELRRGPRGGAFIVDSEGDRSIGLFGRTFQFTDISVAQVTQAMRSITMMLLDTAAPVLSDDDIVLLEANIAEAEATPDRLERSAVIIRFYALLAEATGNRILIELAEAFCEILSTWVRRLGSLESERVLAARRAIVGAIKRRDVAAARSELDRYLTELHCLWLAGDCG